jgi:DegV family protein with EDD domain
MADFVLSCTTHLDLPKEYVDSRNIYYTSAPYFMNGVEHRDDLYQTISAENFYQAMVDGVNVTTSQPNMQEFLDYFETILKEGKDILHISLSSGLSGTHQSAVNAVNAAREKYPERKIYIVDSLAAASGIGLFMDKLADLRDAGMSIEEIRDWAEENKLKLHHWFFTTDLTFFIKGGRVSKTAGTVAGVLGICPLLNVSNEGKLVSREKVRSKKKVIKRIVEKMEEFADGGAEYAEKCFMCHSACIEDAEAVAKLVKEKFPNIKGDVMINNIGTSIGAHTGPGTVALFFWGAKRED